MSLRLRKVLPILALVVIAGLTMAAAALSSSDVLEIAKDRFLRDAPQTPPVTAAEQVLAAIQEEGREQVRAIALRIETTRDPEERLALQREVVEIKQQTRLRFLETLAVQAGERGDLDQQTEALRQVDLILNPPSPHHGRPSTEELRKMKVAEEARP